MTLRWLPEAWQYVQRLYDFLVDKDPAAAATTIPYRQNPALQSPPGLISPENGLPHTAANRKCTHLQTQPAMQGIYLIRRVRDFGVTLRLRRHRVQIVSNVPRSLAAAIHHHRRASRLSPRGTCVASTRTRGEIHDGLRTWRFLV